MNDPRFSCHFTRSDLGLLRRQVGEFAVGAGMGERDRQDLVLAIDEIATNAVLHGGGAGDLELWVDGATLWFRIADKGSGLSREPATAPPEPTQAGGRGMYIARRVTDSLSVQTGSRGTTVTAAKAIPS